MSDEKLAAPRCCNTRRFLHWGFWTSCRNLLFCIMKGRLQIIATVPYLYYSLLQQNPEAKMERWLAILFSRSVKLFVAKQYRIYPRQVISNISAISRTEKRVETSPFFWNLTIISYRMRLTERLSLTNLLLWSLPMERMTVLQVNGPVVEIYRA